ncbi:hypothetical protein MMC13_005441 [Lambiella insularis]|nr:hypothetical protein [Lambiella insularis]
MVGLPDRCCADLYARDAACYYDLYARDAEADYDLYERDAEADDYYDLSARDLGGDVDIFARGQVISKFTDKDKKKDKDNKKDKDKKKDEDKKAHAPVPRLPQDVHGPLLQEPETSQGRVDQLLRGGSGGYAGD